MTAAPSTDRDPFGLCGRVLSDKYRVLEVVGEGGFGIVYRGVHQGFDEPIALKCLKVPAHFDRKAEQALVAGLRAEGRLLLRLSQRSAGIVQALDVGSFETARGAVVPYLVLEWLDGCSLAAELAARRARGVTGMSLGEALALLEPAARALGVAHAENIAHRDVKPENLFLVGSGGGRTVKVLDFGIAKVLSEAATPETAGTTGAGMSFTPPYAAPEQFDHRRGTSGPWTDVFALALVFIEVVAGRRALQGDTAVDYLRASSDPLARPSLRAAGVAAPDDVERVLACALEVDPSARYRTAQTFWDELARAVQAHAASDGAAHVHAAAAESRATEDPSVSTAEFLRATAAAPSEGAQADGGTGSRAREPRVGRATTAGAGGETATSTTRAPTTSATTAPLAPAARSKRTRVALAALVALVGAGCAAGLALLLRARGEPDGAETGSAPDTSTASAATASAPISQNPEAAALYAEALEAWRGGSPDAAVRAMEHAAALDRDLGAAHIRLSLWKFGKRPVDARDHYDLALRHAGALRPRDAGLLAAIEPMLREPSDFEELDARLAKLCAAAPADAELWSYLGAARLKRLRFDEALAAADAALASDPGHVGAWVLKAESLSMKGDTSAQLAAYQACLERVPRALECLNKQIGVRSMLGDCAGMRDDAKRLLAMNPRSATTQRQLGLALFATGAPRDAVLQALGESAALRAEGERVPAELADRAALATLDGDFEDAATLFGAWQRAVERRPDESSHAAPAFGLADLYLEMGEPARAAAVAEDFQRHMSAWSEPPEGDWTLTALGFELRAAKITPDAFAAARSAWIDTVRRKWQSAGKRLDRESEWTLWAGAYGAIVTTEAEARAAVAALPAAASQALATGRYAAIDLYAGRAHALAGDFRAALPHLTRAARSCPSLAEPLLTTRAQLWLGVALEGSGDRAGARAAYEKVLARWGRARPRSESAASARARLALLGATP